MTKLPITVIIAIKNEEINLPRCLKALEPAQRVILIDSCSTDNSLQIANEFGVEIFQFVYKGGYPKKRQWALDNLQIETPWVFMLDADEIIEKELWNEIQKEIDHSSVSAEAFLIKKRFHFLGRPFRFGGFSHHAVLMFKTGLGRYENLMDDISGGLDMEVHERVIVDGRIKKLRASVTHNDFKGLEAYIARHNKYSSWEARLRFNYLKTGSYGIQTIEPNLFGNSQERRRAIKALVIKIPFESLLWFSYHYFFKLGFMEGKLGYIACQIRASYIAQVKAKIYELNLHNERNS